MRKDSASRQIIDFSISENKRTILTLSLVVIACIPIVLSILGIYRLHMTIAAFVLFLFASVSAITADTRKFRMHKYKTILWENDYESLLDSPPGDWTVDDGYAISKTACSRFAHMPIGIGGISQYSYENENIPFVKTILDHRFSMLSPRMAATSSKAVIGLNSDIDKGDDVLLHVTSREAVRATDDAGDCKVIDCKRVHDKIVFDPLSQSFEKGWFKSFSEATNVNEVDISALIEDPDGNIAWRIGDLDHPLYPDQIITSASASLTPKFVEGAKTLQDAMSDAILERIESAMGISREDIESISPMGYVRIVNRCGAPEFFFFVKTKVDVADLESSDMGRIARQGDMEQHEESVSRKAAMEVLRYFMEGKGDDGE